MVGPDVVGPEIFSVDGEASSDLSLAPLKLVAATNDAVQTIGLPGRNDPSGRPPERYRPNKDVVVRGVAVREDLVMVASILTL